MESSAVILNGTPKEVCVPVMVITLPVTARAGTSTVSKFGLAATILANTDELFLPANVTVFSVGLERKPLPLTLIVAPAAPLFGPTVIGGRIWSIGKATTYVPRTPIFAETVRPDSSADAKRFVCEYCFVEGL